ncbi:hypothetical protein [Acetobacter tropicalis]|uniref:hypothetical protein n=1 Tax=Acetobacter tropicalis TaxID=104102 RepID=UPI000586CDAD|nr:hypothetical protein [Acetobacter tropicalis]
MEKEKQIKQHILNTIEHVDDILRNFGNEYKVIKNDNGEFEYVERTYIKEVTTETGKKYTLKLTGDLVIVEISSLEQLRFENRKITYKIYDDSSNTKTEYVCEYFNGALAIISVNTFKLIRLLF